MSIKTGSLDEGGGGRSDGQGSRGTQDLMQKEVGFEGSKSLEAGLEPVGGAGQERAAENRLPHPLPLTQGKPWKSRGASYRH